jgi:hypothetical protein
MRYIILLKPLSVAQHPFGAAATAMRASAAQRNYL